MRILLSIITKILISILLFGIFLNAFAYIISSATAEHIKPGKTSEHGGHFYVAVVPGSSGNPFDVVTLNKVREQSGSFLMPKHEDEFKEIHVYNSSRRSIRCKYTVIETIGGDQVVEVQHHSNDYDFWSRYRVSGREITPISWRIAYVGTALRAFPLALLSTFLFWNVFRRLITRVRRPACDEPEFIPDSN